MDPMNQPKGKASPKTPRGPPRNKGGSSGKQPKAGRNSNSNAPNSRLQARVGQQPQRSVAAAYSTGVSQTEPVITRGKDFVRIQHKELVTNIVGTAAFTVAATIPLNPGMTTFLKWLPIQAIGWETYMWNRLEFRGFTRTGSNIPGSIALVPDYDASDSAPSDEQSASAYKDLVEDAPWKDICCVLPNERLHPLGKRLFIRNSALTANLDIKTYDAGNLFITTNEGTAVNWQKIWCYYDVTLYTPQLPPGGVVSMSSALHIAGTTQTTANAWPNQAIVAPSNAGIATVPATGEVITFLLPGRYDVTYTTTGTTNTQTGAPTISASGSFTVGFFSTNSGTGTASMTQSLIVTVVAGTTLTFNNTIVAGTFYDLLIVALPTA